MPTIWVDAQIAPALAGWMRDVLGLDAIAVRDLGLRHAEDPIIFERARAVGAVVLSKDSDFVDLVLRHGPPPQIVWLTCGNTSNAALRTLFSKTWPRVAALLAANEPLVEIGGTAFSPGLLQPRRRKYCAQDDRWCGRRAAEPSVG